MISLKALVVALAVTGVNETVLLDFTSPHCGPCRQMEPTIQRLQAEGYPVRQINVERQQELAARFRVDRVPCLIMLSDNREVGRVLGPASYDRLVRMYRQANFRPESTASTTPAVSPHGSRGAVVTPTTVAASGAAAGGIRPAAMQSPTNDPSGGGGSVPESNISLTPHQLAFQASVRLRVEDPDGQSCGSGTIIDNHGGESLVLTCAHIFRDSRGQGTIHVDLFPGSGRRTVTGQLISHDMDKDIALVAIRPGCEITPAAVASDRAGIRGGEAVFTIGCSHGADPTLQRSRITAVNKYLGPANFEVGGQPADGRSGGGLFLNDGRLVGVCNAADPADNEGIYAALPVVHWQLSHVGLAHLFRESDTVPVARGPVRSRSSVPSTGNVAVDSPRPAVQPISRRDLDAARAADPNRPAGNLDPLLDLARKVSPGGELICVLRNGAEDRRADRVVVLDWEDCRTLQGIASGDDGSRRRQTTGDDSHDGPRPWESDARDHSGRIIRAQSAQ